MRIDNFFAELKRRNVYKVTVAYVVVAWLVHSSGINFSSRVQCAAMGDTNYHPHSCCWFSDCSGFFLGVRDHAGGNQTRIGD
jgi:hypothetical protein